MTVCFKGFITCLLDFFPFYFPALGVGEGIPGLRVERNDQSQYVVKPDYLGLFNLPLISMSLQDAKCFINCSFKFVGKCNTSLNREAREALLSFPSAYQHKKKQILVAYASFKSLIYQNGKDCGFHQALRVLAMWALALPVRLSGTCLHDASDGQVLV